MSKRVLLWLAATLALAAAVHYLAIVAYPRFLMISLMRRLEDRHGRNALRHGNRPTPEDRVVVLPSPDLLYSIGVYDVTSAPLRITAPAGSTYVSLSLYADNTDNFFVINDRQVGDGKFDVVLVGPKAPEPDGKDAPVVRAPTNTGIILFRYFADEKTPAEDIESLRRQIVCVPVR
jgi:uncharacterized membrane protein